MEITQVKLPERYRHRLTNQHESSAKYGDCEVCKFPVSEVYALVTERAFTFAGEDHWAQERGTFGHKECLEQLVKGPVTEGAT